jgi:hypothetical protein
MNQKKRRKEQPPEINYLCVLPHKFVWLLRLRDFPGTIFRYVCWRQIALNSFLSLLWFSSYVYTKLMLIWNLGIRDSPCTLFTHSLFYFSFLFFLKLTTSKHPNPKCAPQLLFNKIISPQNWVEKMETKMKMFEMRQKKKLSHPSRSST